MKIPFKRFFTATLMLAFTVLFISNAAQAQGDSESATQGKTVYEVVDSKDNTSEFATLLNESGYSKILKQQGGTYTVLAPSNEAVEQTDAELKENPKKLMQGQLFKGEVPKDQVESQMGVTVQETDNSAANGIVHIVDTVTQQ
jgi:uncharacterized surface protein with fasciclin (FAS1) repeats